MPTQFIEVVIATGEIWGVSLVPWGNYEPEPGNAVYVVDHPTIIDPDTEYFVVLEILPRLQITPPAPSGYAPLVVSMASFPAGTQVVAINGAGEAVITSDPADPIQIPEPGKYRIIAFPPFPAKGFDVEVELV